MLAAAIAACSVAAPTVAAANPKYASIVIDANTGKVLHQSSADAPRYPASLTKMMTLYMIFEALQSGRISKSTKVPFSKHAAAKPPTKLGVRAGGSVTVETVIYSLVTKSANDAAAAMGELLGGSEANFAKLMTAKARSLGMSSTTFRNASGLPDNGQKTTARDMATLGIALREHFPNYYDYFSTRSYKFGKSTLTNHNRLLGRVKGVDGIKTGYIRASGFNLVSSVKTGGRSIVAVVMGGRTGASRDAHMRELIQKYLPRASTRDGGPLIAARRIQPGSAVAAGALVLPNQIPLPDYRPDDEVQLEEVVMAAYAPAAKIAAPQPFTAPAAPSASADLVAAPVPPAAIPAPERFVRLPADIDPLNTASTPVKGWVIQVASMPSEAEARLFLMKTSLRAPTLLADATAFTQSFDNNGTVYHRARFGGFDSKSAAWGACDALKEQKIACYAVQQ
jgi:D-alanyl-D-alanine carboxypeptidase